MIKREVYETIGGIDEIFSPGGYCDNDYCKRAIDAGYGLVIATNVFVYHKGSVTLHKYYPELAMGVANWHKFYSKYHKADISKKVLLLTPLSINSEEELEQYKKNCAINQQYFDGVVIVDNQSKHFNWEAAKEVWGEKLVSYHRNSKRELESDSGDYRILVNTAQQYKDVFEWVMLLTQDESIFYEDGLNPFTRLANNIHPSVYIYSFMKTESWKSTDYIVRQTGEGEEEESPVFVNRMWKNLVYSSSEVLRYDARKFSISVNMLNKGQGETTNLVRQINLYWGIVDEWIIGDTSGTGEVKNAVKNFSNFLTCFDHSLNDNFGKARNDLIDKSKSKFIMHIDPDEIGDTNNPYEIVYNLLNGCDLIMWKLANRQVDGREHTTEQPRIFINNGQIRYNGRVHETIGPAIQNYNNSNPSRLVAVTGSVKSLNTGFINNVDDIDRKLALYGKLLSMEVDENPGNYKAHYELALHYINQNEEDKAEKHLLMSMQANSNYVPPIKDLAILKLTQAYDIINECEGKHAPSDIVDAIKSIRNITKPWKEARTIVGSGKIYKDV
jgi:hypothetical protein